MQLCTAENIAMLASGIFILWMAYYKEHFNTAGGQHKCLHVTIELPHEIN